MSQEPKVTRFGALPTVDAELATKAYVDSGGGAGLTFAKVVKTVDQIVNNSTTLQDDDELLFTPNINTTYHGILLIIYNSSVNADFKSAFSLPAGAVGEWLDNNALWRISAQVYANITTAFGISGSGVGLPRASSQHFVIKMGATAGDCNFQWCQNTLEVSDTIVEEGSLLLVWEE